ncbi:MAG: hypothetical protein A2426_04080 [Candidatus Lambdaproteobacteria bacterium RIFOXYC1_FULL_56_13]|nr:MAG: hypothetical protein A2426_04080 [Candidatus Lambdaproteobacteria bacterium RIFOXYC1_FULL_56_13]
MKPWKGTPSVGDPKGANLQAGKEPLDQPKSSRQTYKKAEKRFFLALVFLCFLASPLWAQEVLVFSTSHNSQGLTEVKEPEGRLEVTVSAFDPILEFHTPGQAQVEVSGSSGHAVIPYRLTQTETTFTVEVVTAKGRVRKDFVLVWVKPQESAPAGETFSLISLLGLQNSDNVTNLPAGAQVSGTKASLTLIPRYSTRLEGLDLPLEVGGILLKEKYGSTDLAPQEINFAQASLTLKGTTELGDWKTQVGANDIGTQTQGLGAKTPLETDRFLALGFGPSPWEDNRLGLELTLTAKDLKAGTDPLYNGDGIFYLLDLTWMRPLGAFRFRSKASSERNDAKSGYQDYSAYRLGLNLDYPIAQDLELGGSLVLQNKGFARHDPLKGAQESATQSTYGLNANWATPWAQGLNLTLDLRNKQNRSNVSQLSYQTRTLSLSLVYLR